MKFTLNIELGNDMMESSLHVSNALREVADRLTDKDYPLDRPVGPRGIMDANGNLVGSWSITEGD